MSLLFQFTEEDNQNKVEHALKREKKVKRQNEGRTHKNKHRNCAMALHLMPSTRQITEQSANQSRENKVPEIKMAPMWQGTHFKALTQSGQMPSNESFELRVASTRGNFFTL